MPKKRTKKKTSNPFSIGSAIRSLTGRKRKLREAEKKSGSR